mmetsp:Transcript_9565/g.15666  ORF Transcript_9565/g.15666 Transcript_9565/m.15666 type:complete len:116 (+) Transcript_9565:1284-1631(+)
MSIEQPEDWPKLSLTDTCFLDNVRIPISPFVPNLWRFHNPELVDQAPDGEEERREALAKTIPKEPLGQVGDQACREEHVPQRLGLCRIIQRGDIELVLLPAGTKVLEQEEEQQHA